MGYKNNNRMDMETRQNNIQERIRETSWEYHTNLMKLLHNKVDPVSSALSKKELQVLQEDINNNFGTIVAHQQNMINLSFDIAKITLESAFNKCGFEFGDDGELLTPSTDIEKSNG